MANGILGCVDSDQDGWADDNDAMPNEPTQWADSDGDGYGDNLAGVNPDACPSQNGDSTVAIDLVVQMMMVMVGIT